jgi:hypothetical protein
MDLINGYSPKALKKYDNNYDLYNKKSDNAFPGKKMFNSTCFLKNPKKYNNINLNENFLNFDHFKDIMDNSTLLNNQNLKEGSNQKSKEESKEESEEESEEESNKKKLKKIVLGQLANSLQQGMIETENDNNGNCDNIEEEMKKYKEEIKKYKEENSKYKEENSKYKKYINESQYSQYNIEYNPVMMTLYEHENEAIKKGGHLISIHNTFELNEIKKYWDKNCWIGAKRVYSYNSDDKGTDKNTWKWMDNSEWNYHNFSSKSPNNYKNRQNGIKLQDDGTWNDWTETHKLGGIYKIPKKAVNNQLNNCNKKINIIDNNIKKNDKISLNNKYRMQKIINNNLSQIYSNIDNIEKFSNFENFTGVNELVKYNEDLTNKQKNQQDKIRLIKEKELSLEKTNALFISSKDRNNFKKKIIYTLIAVIFFLFILSISTYIYFIRDFKINN